MTPRRQCGNENRAETGEKRPTAGHSWHSEAISLRAALEYVLKQRKTALALAYSVFVRQNLTPKFLAAPGHRPPEYGRCVGRSMQPGTLKLWRVGRCLSAIM